MSSSPPRSLLLFLALGLLVRSPTWIRPSTTRFSQAFSVDEDTFILVAQRVLRGELPWTTVLDNKPPVSGFVHAAALQIFGETLLGFRVGLAVVLSVTAWALHQTIVNVTRRSAAGLVAGGGFLVLSLLVPGGVAWKTQATANAFLALLIFRASAPPSVRNSALGGALVALLGLTRQPYLAAVPAVVLLTPHLHVQPGRGRRIASAVAGTLLPLTVIAALYTSAGLGATFWEQLVGARFSRLARAVAAAPLPGWAWEAALLHGGILLVTYALMALGRPASVDSRVRTWVHITALTQLLMMLSLRVHYGIHAHYFQMLLVPLLLQLGLMIAIAGRQFVSGVIRGAPHLAGVLSLVLPVLPVGHLLLLTPVDVRQVSESLATQAVLPDHEAELSEELGAQLRARPGTVWALSHNHVYWRQRILPVHPMLGFPPWVTNPGQTVLLADGDPLKGSSGPADVLDRILDLEPDYLVGSVGVDEWYLRQIDRRDGVAALEGFRARVEREYRLIWWDCGADTAIRERVTEQAELVRPDRLPPPCVTD